MSDLNSLSLVGWIVRVHSLVQGTDSKLDILKFVICVNISEKDKTMGIWKDRPNFFDATIFGAKAESLSRYLQKGARVSLLGKLFQNSWEKKDGTKMQSVGIIVQDCKILNKPKAVEVSEEYRDKYNERADVHAFGGSQEWHKSSREFEDDIPF